MESKKVYPAFDVAGYKCKIQFIRAEAADRYGWKDDHIVVWVKFTPTVGGVISTEIEIPAKSYDRDSLIATIKEEVGVCIARILAEDRTRRRIETDDAKKQAAIDLYAEKMSWLLEEKESE